MDLSHAGPPELQELTRRPTGWQVPAADMPPRAYGPGAGAPHPAIRDGAAQAAALQNAPLGSPGTRWDHHLLWQSLGGPGAEPSPWNPYLPHDPFAVHVPVAAADPVGLVHPPASHAEPAHAQQARHQLGNIVHTALAQLNDLLKANVDPELAGFPIKAWDRHLMPLLVASENWRRPQLNLVALHTELAEDPDEGATAAAGSSNVRQFIEAAPFGRYRALVDDGQHIRAADIHKSEYGVSVVAIDPAQPSNANADNEREEIADLFKENFGEGAKLAFIPLDVQKSGFGCRVFSMSLALKMHAREDVFTDFHHALAADDVWSRVPDATLTDGDAFIVRDAGHLVDASMMKHSQSRSSIKKYLEDHPDQKRVRVNAKNEETLVARAKRHLVTRRIPERTLPGEPKKTKTVKFSNSIELKRIALLERSLRYVAEAPAEEVHRLSALVPPTHPG
ncbi:YopJ family acetyltransferase [Roseateles sp. MS654]|uniref:YopJ family acetyltransferase n=1 Tax=Roseateles sp. MS654 TaxID=3412685 RepID=UPI003C2BA2B6